MAVDAQETGFVEGQLRGGNRNGFSGELPEDCSYTIGAHFLCARLLDPGRGDCLTELSCDRRRLTVML